FLISGFVASIGIFFIAFTMAAGLFLAIVFVGLLLIAASLRATRQIGSWQRALANHFLDEHIADPDPFRPPPGFFGWLQAALRYAASWRALAYAVLKIPLFLFGIWFGLSVWIEAFLALTAAVGRAHAGVDRFGPISIGPAGPFGSAGPLHPLGLFVYGVFLFLVAPWPMRLVVYLDRRLCRLFLGPDSMTAPATALHH